MELDSGSQGEERFEYNLVEYENMATQDICDACGATEKLSQPNKRFNNESASISKEKGVGEKEKYVWGIEGRRCVLVERKISLSQLKYTVCWCSMIVTVVIAFFHSLGKVIRKNISRTCAKSKFRKTILDASISPAKQK